MKKINLITNILLALLVNFSITSCSTDDENDTTLQENIENNTQTGTWRITKFIDSGIDKTTDLSSYTFTFNNSGALGAFDGTNNFNGLWNIISYGSDLNDIELNIVFNLVNNLDELTDDWDFISQTSNKIGLIDISGGDEPDDYLTFERN